jgi:hypothetical protein
MSKPDRNVSYMQETFGTNSLITDYKPKKNDTFTITDVILNLDNIITMKHENTGDLYAEGYFYGLIDCAKNIKTQLEKLQ